MKRFFSLISIGVLIFFTSVLYVDASGVSLLRTPSVSPDGKEVAFSYHGDIWKVSINGGRAVRLTDHVGFEISPVYSPDGKYIAFSSDRNGNYDVFVIDSEGGVPRQITFRDASDYVTDWTPDGKYIVYHTRGFLHHFYGSVNIFRVPFEGGTSETFVPELSRNGKLSHDGNFVVFNYGTAPELRKRYEGSADMEVYLYNIMENSYKNISQYKGNDKWPQFSKDDKYVYFVSDRGEKGVFNLFNVNRDTGKIKQLTFFEEGQVRYPSIAKNTNTLVFEYKDQLYKLTGDGNPEKIDISAPSDYKAPMVEKKTYRNRARNMKLSPDGEEIAFVVRGEVFVMREDGELTNRITNSSYREKDICWSKDGKTLFFTSDRDGNYNIYKVVSDDKEREKLSEALKFKVEKLTETPDDESGLKLSPDGEKLSYIRGKGNLIIRDIETGDEKVLFEGWDTPEYNWSPDSKWIVYSQNDNNFNREIYIIPSSGGEKHNISQYPDMDESPVFSDDGKKLFFISKRGSTTARTVNNNIDIYMVFLQKKYDEMTEFELKRLEEKKKEKEKGKKNKQDKKKKEKKIVKIDFENIHKRVRRVTKLFGAETTLAVSPDGKTIAFTSYEEKGRNLYTIKWNGKKLKQLTKNGKGANDITWSDDGKKIYFRTDNGSFAKINANGSGYSAISYKAKVIINKKKENAQKYNEAWKVLYNYFYDKNFHGIDWKKTKEYYKQWALNTRTSNDFNYVFSMLLGELNSSHQGIYGPWDRDERIETGYLGVFFDKSYKGQGLKITKVLKYGPGDREVSKLKKGDILLAVDNEDIKNNTNVYELLEDAAGEKILIRIDRNGEEKEIAVRPINSGELSSIYYRNIIEERRKFVEEKTNNKLTYVHIRSMGTSNARKFEKQLYSVANGKDGLIIDVRNNGGGWITDLLLTMLMTRQHAITIPRDGGKGYPQSRRVLFNWAKPIVVLINENSYSNAEIFPWSIRTLKRGKLVGEKTFGAVISTGGKGLIDGSYVRMPFRGWYVNDGSMTNMEHNGCPPDVHVKYKLGGLSKNEDLQLNKAIEVLQNEVKKAKQLPTWPDWIDVKRK